MDDELSDSLQCIGQVMFVSSTVRRFNIFIYSLTKYFMSSLVDTAHSEE